MEEVEKYFGAGMSPEQRERLERLEGLYRAWNDKINVISRKDIDHLYAHHVLHSLAIMKVRPFAAGDRIMDLGCGGGFPGIPLAVMNPEADFLLVDSIGKKITVVNDVAASLGLTNARGVQARAEALEVRTDYVVSRAVAELGRFMGWVWDKIIPGKGHGILYLKGGDLSEELEAVRKYRGVGEVSVHPIREFFDEPFFDTKQVVYIRKVC